MPAPRRHLARLPRRDRGFTLIELIVVLAVIAMLGAFLFPVFATQREKARRSSCQSNLKQIGLGIMQYCRNYDEKYPRPSYGNPRLVWQQVLQPYTKSPQLFVCPSSGAFDSPGTYVNLAAGGYPPILRSYGLNHRVSYGDREVSIADMRSPAHKIMVAESRAPWPDYGSAWWKGGEWQQGFADHLKTANYLFCDGHVKSMMPLGTSTPFNMWGGIDGGVCKSRSLNCDKPEPVIIKGLQALQDAS